MVFASSAEEAIISRMMEIVSINVDRDLLIAKQNRASGPQDNKLPHPTWNTKLGTNDEVGLQRHLGCSKSQCEPTKHWMLLKDLHGSQKLTILMSET